MKTRRVVTATELARNLSSLLSEVRYGGVTLDVRRGKERMAIVQPPTGPASGTRSDVPAGFPIDRLNAFLDALPRLDATEARAFMEDIRSIDDAVGRLDDPWDS